MHGECLATAGLTVCKDGRVEPTDSRLDKRAYGCCVDAPCVIFRAVHSVECPPRRENVFNGREQFGQTSSCWTFEPRPSSLPSRKLCSGSSSSPSRSGSSCAPATSPVISRKLKKTNQDLIEAYHNTDILPRLGHGGRDGLQSDLKHIWQFSIYCFDSGPE